LKSIDYFYFIYASIGELGRSFTGSVARSRASRELLQF